MDKGLEELLDSLNKKGGKEAQEKNDEARQKSAELILDMVNNHRVIYGTASALAAISALVVAGFGMAMKHSRDEEKDG